VVVSAVSPPEKKEKIIVPPPEKKENPKVKTLIYTAPKIMQDPPEEEKPPLVNELDKAKIGTINQNGDEDKGITAPSNDDGKGIVEAPKKADVGDVPFTKVEIESEYPGGMSSWAAFLNRNLVYPEPAIENEIQGTVLIQFIVDVLGNVSDVKAISGPEELRASAVAVIKKSGKWTPAIQNGQKVKSYKTQPIVFKLATDN